MPTPSARAQVLLELLVGDRDLQLLAQTLQDEVGLEPACGRLALLVGDLLLLVIVVARMVVLVTDPGAALCLIPLAAHGLDVVLHQAVGQLDRVLLDQPLEQLAPQALAAYVLPARRQL